LLGVLAVLASACVANGSWELTAPVDPVTTRPWDNPRFLDVSCPTAEFCMGVGSAAGYPLGATTDVGVPLVEVWDGEAWSEVEFASRWPDPDPHTEDDVASKPRSVECLSPTDCRVIVTEYIGWDVWTGMYRWDGVTWSLALDHGTEGGFDAFDCAPDGACLAIWNGWDGAQVFDGAAWGPEVDPTEATDLSCASASMCLAVRDDVVGGVSRWDGAGWVPVDAGGMRARGVDCPSTSRCVLVGEIAGPVGADPAPAVAVWDGTSVVAHPPGVDGPGSLVAVACASVIECLVVGTATGGDPATTGPVSIAHNGVAFYPTGGSPPGPADAVVEGVSCAPQLCMAVGWVGSDAASDLHAAAYRWAPWPPPEG
jgi:hypothetical protein